MKDIDSHTTTTTTTRTTKYRVLIDIHNAVTEYRRMKNMKNMNTAYNLASQNILQMERENHDSVTKRMLTPPEAWRLSAQGRDVWLDKDKATGQVVYYVLAVEGKV